jgi:serpin B
MFDDDEWAKRNEDLYQANRFAGIVGANPDVQTLVSGSSEFAFKMLDLLIREHPQENVFFSPFSLAQALSLAMNGTGGRTREEISETLGIDDLSLDQANIASELLLQTLANIDPEVSLTVANGVWSDLHMEMAADFVTRCNTQYGAQIASLDFTSPSAADAINDWVSQKTQNVIQDLVGSSDLLPGAVVLANTLYFKGEWSHPFEIDDTNDGDFIRQDGVRLSLPMMAQDSRYKYLETTEFQAIELSYGTGRILLNIFLPKPGDCVEAIARKLDGNRFLGYVNKMEHQEVALVLPSFSVDCSVDLGGYLQSLGVISAFGHSADFGPMGLPNGFIGRVRQKVVLTIDEEGTMAAAATMGAVAAGLPPEPKVTMRVNRPFFCTICDNKTGTILFMGIIRAPQVNEKRQ